MKKYLFIFATLFCFDCFSQDKLNFELLFSPTGDTVLTFGGGINDSVDFIVVKKVNDSIDFVDGFRIKVTKNKVNHLDYPSDFLKKYNLVVPDTFINIATTNDVLIKQKILIHKKISKAAWTPDWSDQYYIFKVVLSISIKVCNKTILKNYQVERQYEGPEKEKDVIFKNSDIIARLVKMKGRQVYFFYVNIYESVYDKSKKIKNTHLKYDKGQIINCH